MTGWEGEPMIHTDTFYERKIHARHLLGKPRYGPRRIDNMLEQLRRQRRTDHRRGGKDTVSQTAEEQHRHAHDVREPFCDLRVIPIEYIARGRVTIA